RLAPAPEIRIIDDVVVNERRGVDELHDGRVQCAAVAAVARQARCHEQDSRTETLAAARSNVLTDRRDQIDVRLEMPLEFAIDLVEVGAYRFEDRREIRRRFFHSCSGGLYHGRNNGWKFA